MIGYARGEFVEDRLEIGLDAAHFRYGAGFFETVYYNGHMLRHLDEHVRRISASLEACGIACARIPFEEVILELLRRNGLAGKPARVNILYPVDDFGEKAQPHVFVAPYAPQPGKEYRLAVYPRSHMSYLNEHKTLSYMHFALARRHAVAQGLDDSLLTDDRGRVLETSTAALLFHDGKNCVLPKSGYAFKSISLDFARKVLPLRPREVHLRDLGQFRHAWVLNSLIGMKPVSAIGEFSFEPDRRTAELVSLNIL